MAGFDVAGSEKHVDRNHHDGGANKVVEDHHCCRAGPHVLLAVLSWQELLQDLLCL